MNTGSDHGKPHSMWLSRAALALVAGAAVMGWGASFVGLHAYGLSQMVGFSYWTAWLVPGTFDGAAFGATLITYRASIYGRSALRGRLLMWSFTGISSWINWIHQAGVESRIVAAGLPLAAVAVFDVVLHEMRADYEERHGQHRFRLRLGLLALRWMTDRSGTAAAFRRQVTGIPVSAIAGLGIREAADAAKAPAQPAPAAPLDWGNLAQAPAPTGRAVESDALSVPDGHGVDQQVAGQPARPAQPSGTTGTTAAQVPETPAERTDELPVTTDSPAAARDEARQLVRQFPDRWSGAALGERFGMSERWGRNQISAVRQELDEWASKEAERQTKVRHLMAAGE